MDVDEAIRSASLAAMNLMTAAQALGLASAPMGGFDAAAVCADFGLASTELPVMLVAMVPSRAGPLATHTSQTGRRSFDLRGTGTLTLTNC